jgi:hypothetical protein
MTTVNGLPAHVLLVHFVVVLAPLTAVLAITCALWRPARQRLIWLVAALAMLSTVLTPVTTDAGEWLERRVGPSERLHAHTDLGDTMIYFSVALLLAVVLLVVVHVRESRDRPVRAQMHWLIAAVVVAAGVSTGVQVYRIGESGAAATWGDQVAQPSP